MALSEKDVHEIMNRFDFDSAHEFMEETNWIWYNIGSETPGIPEVSDLQFKARELLFEALHHEEDSTVIRCGGFAAIKIKNVGLMLFFVPFEEDVWVL